MPRKYPLLVFILLFLCLLLAFTPLRPANAADLVAVRIPTDGDARASAAAIRAERVIDYGSFLWAVMDRSALSELEKAKIPFQTIENPYTLTLGGQSFDPLVSSPDFAGILGDKAQTTDGAGLHLVQFHGPTQDAWLEALKAAGLEMVQYIYPYTYVVWGDAAALAQSREQAAVRWAGDYLPAYAVSPQNRVLSAEPLLVRAVIAPQAGLEATITAIEALGGQWLGSVSGVDPDFDLATFFLPGNQMLAAAQVPGVYTLSPVPLDGGDRGELANQVNVGNVDGSNLAYPGYQDWLAQVGLSGAGVVIANVDSGVDQTHPDLVNRFLSCTGATCSDSVSDHGTHTAGLMAGDGSGGIRDAFGFLRGLGMAPGANLVGQDYHPTYLDPGGMLTLMTDSVRNGAVVSGNSWGPSGTPLGYDEDTRLVDMGVRDADPDEPGNQELSYILSIMNGYGGVSTQGTPDEAKNAFTVGSTTLQSSTGSQQININDLSANTAHGPALDGRTIPHLVAPGCYADSTISGGSYELKCGTSMASPQVSGAVALFIERYRQLYGTNPSPALVKAAFLPVAHDLAGNKDADGYELGHPFDSKQGWGRLNTEAVLDPAINTTVIYLDQETLFNDTGETWTYPLEDLGPFYHIQAMLVWTDAPGTPSGSSTPAWVNDLDLSLTVGADTYYGNNFNTYGFSATGGSPDGMNNTEGIFLDFQTIPSITFTVSAANIAGDGVPDNVDSTDQDFALAIYITEFETVHRFPLFFH